MSEITIEAVSTRGSTVECSIGYDKSLRRFFTGERFVADYDVGVDGVPESIAVLPVLAHVCPVAWANGADVRAPIVDATYLDSLNAVGNAIVDMYPKFMQGGAVRVDEAIDTDLRQSGSNASAMLFTGGVDSVATYLRHRREDPALVSIQGWVIGRDEPDRWANVQRQVESFAAPRGLETYAITSNMLDVIDTPMLQAHYQRHLDGAWYSSVGHGIGLLSLCAPLAYVEGFETLYMAASHTEAFSEPWGSHPRIDDQVRWAGTTASHDGFELSRQDKIERIGEYVRRGHGDIALRTCIHEASGENCNECEKCYRTMVGLVVAGLDPNEHGYEMTPSTFDTIRRAFERGEFVLMEHTRFHWEDIRNHLPVDGPHPIAGATEFLRWLENADFDEFTERAQIPLRDRLVRAGMRQTPFPVYRTVYSLYDQARRL